MRDSRLTELAKTLVHHSIQLKENEKVVIKAHHSTKPLLKEIIKEVYANNSYPYVNLMDDEVTRYLAKGYERNQLEKQAEWDLQQYKDIDAIIAIIAEENDAELADVPSEKFKLRGEIYKPVQQFYINNRRWVLLNYPTKGLAQKSGMSYEQFTDYLLDVCNVDYEKMSKAQQPLKELMEKTDKVRITAPGTDLQFSIKGIPAITCAGEHNIPDGEVFTAPVKDSVNGTITYNTPCPYQGKTYHDVSLTFKNGKIVEAKADKTKEINEVFDTDEGARYVGEFAIGVNPLIKTPMGDILFDEKIGGSIHFTPGEAYEEADNGNKSAIHWDMVLIQTPQYGGGELYFDDVLIRKDGMFVLPELESLNPENLT